MPPIILAVIFIVSVITAITVLALVVIYYDGLHFKFRIPSLIVSLFSTVLAPLVQYYYYKKRIDRLGQALQMWNRLKHTFANHKLKLIETSEFRLV